MDIVIMLVGMAVVAGIVGIVMSRGKASLMAKVEELSALLESVKSGAVELQARLDGETSARIKAETIATKLPDLEAAMAAIRHEKEGLLAGMAGLDAQMQAERKSAEEKQKLIEEAGQKLNESFKSLAADALQGNNKAFLQLASENLARFNEKAKQELLAREKSVENMVKPIGDTLAKVDAALRSVEKERVSAYSGLVAEVKGLAEANVQVRSETSKLVTALRRPQVRGAWGEMQLRRIAELAGMSEHCDFAEQVTTDNGNGAKNTRPDMVVSLPGGKHVVVDSKAPIDASFDGADESSRAKHLANSAKLLRIHMKSLANKEYWKGLDLSPDFVVMFLPGDGFLSEVLSHDRELVEECAKLGVIPASPLTLILLLKTIAFGWRQEAIAENAQKISALGRELHERVSKFLITLNLVGKKLEDTVMNFNSAMTSAESRLLVTGRKLGECVGAKENALETHLIEARPKVTSARRPKPHVVRTKVKRP